MRKLLSTAALLVPALLVALSSTHGPIQKSNSAPKVKWSVLTPTQRRSVAPVRDDFKSIIRMEITGLDSIDKFCFNQLPRPLEAVAAGDSVHEIVAGYYYVTSPQFHDAGPYTIDIASTWGLTAKGERPEGFHAVTTSGKIVPLTDCGHPFALAAAADSAWLSSTTPADSIYRRNETLSKGQLPGPFDIVPSFKNVEIKEGTYDGNNDIITRIISHDNPEYYRITLTPTVAIIEGASQKAVAMAERTLRRRLLEPNGGSLPCAVIEDWPDYPYRGLMIDIARSYHSPEAMRRYADMMADYRLNTLHFHIADDEAWRLEIPGLPELTEVGSRRGYTLDSHDFLPQIYSGDGNPATSEGIANGHFSRRDFIDFIRYCDSIGIRVIPEIESPGHARAAVMAMKARLRATGDDTYLLTDPLDTSRYTTAQWLHDNLMNPGVEGPYRFMGKVADEIAAMYGEAGVSLPGIHIGGDEVPRGAWDGSPAVKALEARTGIKGKNAVHGEFVRRIASIFSDKGIPVYGWQDISIGHDSVFNADLSPKVAGINCWVSAYEPSRNVGVKALKNGYPVILSNVDYFYMDMLYDWQPDEEGLHWGGTVDEFQSLSGFASSLCPEPGNAKACVIGVSGQLFGETVRDDRQPERMLLPKVFGLAERGWNAMPTYSEPDFNILLGVKELPRLSRIGYEWHLRRPGITVADGKILMNSPYPGAEILYTLDGTLPDSESKRYTSPIEIGEVQESVACGDGMVRAILKMDGRESGVVTMPLPF